MGMGRLEAFSDGVLAIITIMVLELKTPADGTPPPHPTYGTPPR